MSDYIVENDDGTITIMFKRAVKSDNDKIADITEITLKIPTIGDVEASDNAKGDVGKTIRIIQSLSGVSTAMIRRIAMSDFANIGEALEMHMGGEKKPQATGED